MSARICDPREHQPAAAGLRALIRFSTAVCQRFVLTFRQCHDIVGGLLQRHEPAAAAKRIGSSNGVDHGIAR